MINILKSAFNNAHAKLVMKRRVNILSHQLLRQIPYGTSILDVGCGDGTIAKSIEYLNPRLSFTGVDVFLRPHVAIPAQVYDGVKLPFRDKSFDWIMIVDVIHHTEKPKILLGECLRVARHGIIIKDHLVEGFAAASTLSFMDWVGNRGHDVYLPYNYLTFDQWSQLFSDINCHISNWISSLNLYPFPFSILFDRKLHFIARISLNN